MIEWLAVAIIAVMLGFLYAVRHEKKAKRHYDRMETTRKVGGAIILVALIATFLTSGDLLRIALAIAAALVIGLYIGVEQPHKDVI